MRKIKATKTDKRWSYCKIVRQLTAIFLLLAGLVNAATYYVTADAGGGGVGSQVNPWTITEALLSFSTGGSINAGDIIYIKAGSHTVTSSVSGTRDGTIASPIKVIGCDASWNPTLPTYNAATKRLDFTGCPTVNFNSNPGNLSGADYCYCYGINFVSNRNSYCLYLGANAVIHRCRFYNSNTGSSTIGLTLSTWGNISESEIEIVGSSGTKALDASGNYALVTGSVIIGGSGNGVYANGAYTKLVNNLIFGHSESGVLVNTSTSCLPEVINNTIIGGTYGVYCGDAAYTTKLGLIGNIITGASVRSVYYSNATGSRCVALYNHIYNNTNDAISWSGSLYEYGNLTTNTSDFRNAGSNDYRLAYTAPALNAGVMGNSIGALGPEGLPAPSAVWSNSYIMGTQGTLTLPTAAQVLYNVLFGPDSGTQGNFYVPAESDVKLGVTFGNDNTEFTGEYVGSGGGGTGKQQMPIQRHGY